MQTRLFKKSRQAGSVLFISLIFAIILGTTMASYLYWVRTQNLLVAESQVWNSALVVAEAGIEEGMAQINVMEGGADPLNFTNSTGAIGSANGWSGSGPWTKPNTVVAGSYSVIVSNDFPPTIYSSGTTTNNLLGQTVTRTVKVKTATNSLFGVAIATVLGINFNGNNVTIDAYDSADLVKFPGGLYNSSNAFAGGDVAVEGALANIGNNNIHGRLLLSAGQTYSFQNNGLIGDMPANWALQKGLQSSDWLFNDYNRDFPDVLVPYGSGLAPTASNGTNILTGGNYYYVGANGTSGYSVSILQVNGNSILYAPYGFSASTINISAGSSLKIYVGRASGANVAASFTDVNGLGNANNLQLFGLPTLSGVTLNGNNGFKGTIYAPDCAVTLNGSGNNTLDYQGAMVVKSLTSNGHFNVHYDKNLSRIGSPLGFTLSSWKEL